MKQVLPRTPTDEMSIQVHLYDSHDHDKDLAERRFAPAYRDTVKDRDVYDSSFAGAVTRPSHFIEYLDIFPVSALLSRAFVLRKDQRLPNHVIRELLPHLYIQLQ